MIFQPGGCICAASFDQPSGLFNMVYRPPTWRDKVNGVIGDVKSYRHAYILTAVTSFGGMLFGWDTGMIGGILTTSAFQKSFALQPKSKDFKNLQGNIVSVSNVLSPSVIFAD